MTSASVVINNCNYARFLQAAIDSALLQTHTETEVVVVDDGSRDNSREIIAAYADRVRPVLKSNGGQASAFNAGFEASRGEVILYLDADDLLLPTAVEKAVAALDEADAVKVHWNLRVIEETGRATGRLRPAGRLPQGDLRNAAWRLGPTNHLSAPTSGNAWRRSFLETILPVPELFRQGADTYLFELAPFFGPILALDEPQSLYRRHDSNFHSKMTMDYKLARQIAFYELCVERLGACLPQSCDSTGAEAWVRHSWWHRHARAVVEIASLPRAGEAVILVDDGTWEAGPIGNRRRIPFLERGGEYAGIPADDETALRELARLRQAGAALFIVAWPSFWWFRHYQEFCGRLRAQCPCLLENERLVAFEL